MKNQSLKSSLKITVLLFFGGIILLSLRPIPQPNNTNCNTLRAKVIEVSEGDTKDVVFTLANSQSDINGTFYINRGLESDMSLEQWKSKYYNKTIEVEYLDHWSPLNPFQKLKNIARIKLDGQITFNKLSQ